MDDDCRNGSGWFAKDSIGTSRSADGVAQIVKGFWSIGMPPRGARKDNKKRIVSGKGKITI